MAIATLPLVYASEKGMSRQAATALKIKPGYADVHNNLGNAFMVKEPFDKASSPTAAPCA